MPTFEFTSPEGKTYVIEGPDGATQDQAFKILQGQIGSTQGAPKDEGMLSKAVNFVKDDIASTPKKLGNLAAGAVRGAGSIGATILAPYDIAKDALDGEGLTLESNRQRRADMTAALESLGADPNSVQFNAGKIGAEILGSAGAGGAVANGVRMIPRAGGLANAIASGGLNTGLPAGAVNWLTRLAGGGINGAVTAGIVDPEQAGMGLALGAALPAVAGISGAAGDAISRRMESGSRRLMQSAIKPTIKQLRDGDAQVAVNTLLERGINPNEAGVNRLRALIDDVDNQIGAKIAGSTATVDKGNVLSRLLQTQQGFGRQVSPTADLAAIRAVGDDFLAHPSFPLPQTAIPVQAAQDMKQGTYRVLAKKYGQAGAADVEAQKALARGLKEEIAAAVPEVQPLNEELSRLITTMKVSERRALMEMNKNPMGLAALAHSPTSWALFMADKSALFKSLAARMLNASSGGPGKAAGVLTNSAANPLLRSALERPVTLTNEASP